MNPRLRGTHCARDIGPPLGGNQWSTRCVGSSLSLAGPAANAAGNGKFCLNGPGGQSQCSYQTMASCEKAKKDTQNGTEPTR